MTTKTIRQWLAPPVFPGDEEKTQRAGLLSLVLLICLCLTTLSILAVVLGTTVSTRTLVIVMVWWLLLLQSLRWLHRGKLSWVQLTLTSVFFVVIAAINISQGSVRSSTTALHVFWVTLVVTLYRLPGLVVATSISSLTVLGLIQAENAGLLPQPNLNVGVTQWLFLTILFAVTAALAYYTNQFTQRALERSRSENAQRILAEAELRKLTRAVEQSPASIIITDLDGNIDYVNPRFSSVTGYATDEAIGKNIRLLKSNETRAETYRQMWAALKAGREWRGELVNRKKDGTLYPESTNISPVTDLHGVTTHYLAVNEDITLRKRAEQAWLVSEERHRILAESARDVIWSMAPDGTISYVSPSVEALRGFTPAEAIRQTMDEILTPGSQAISMGYFSKLLADVAAGEPAESFRGELEYRCKDGSTIWTQVIAHPLFSDQGFVELLGVSRDISEHKRLLRELQLAKDATEAANQALQSANAELSRIATTDPLTGIWNRRHFEQVAAAEREQALRYMQPLSMLLFDIDHFKQVNDRFGHQTGDQVLIALTRLVGQALRATDVLARWGGEEFVVVMPHCTEPEAMQLAEKLRVLVAAHPFPQVGAVTVSLGVAQFETDETLDDWFKRVDQALYDAKSGGRNTVRIG
jgi:diguanylate cyclase (GGDEF)-like protein/PAS domain S-box-containing protein